MVMLTDSLLLKQLTLWRCRSGFSLALGRSLVDTLAFSLLSFDLSRAVYQDLPYLAV